MSPRKPQTQDSTPDPEKFTGCLNPGSSHDGFVAANELKTWATLIDQLRADFLALAAAIEELPGEKAHVIGWTKAYRGYKLMLKFLENTETGAFRARMQGRKNRIV